MANVSILFQMQVVSWKLEPSGHPEGVKQARPKKEIKINNIKINNIKNKLGPL